MKDEEYKRDIQITTERVIASLLGATDCFFIYQVSGAGQAIRFISLLMLPLLFIWAPDLLTHFAGKNRALHSTGPDMPIAPLILRIVGWVVLIILSGLCFIIRFH